MRDDEVIRPWLSILGMAPLAVLRLEGRVHSFVMTASSEGLRLGAKDGDHPGPAASGLGPFRHVWGVVGIRVDGRSC